MEIILKEDVKNVGYRLDVIEVKAGFGRNYLIPKGLAVIANKSNLKVLAEDVKQAQNKLAKLKDEAEAIAKKLTGLTLSIGAKVGESGKIFGSVTTIQIADALKEQGIEIDRKKIDLPDEVKTEGEYVAKIDLHREIKAEVKFNVVGE
ncbi:MAG: large subunit ribosomal protein L9 [Sphingobacteriales bacterium]|jgi:large subunit ribosomal protein L9